MPTIYFMFFESRHSGKGITIMSRESLEKMAKDNHHIKGHHKLDVPCSLTYHDFTDILYIPNVKEHRPCFFGINEIISDVRHYVIKLDANSLIEGQTYFEY